MALRPWSTTVRLGGTWLKACGPGTAFEARLLGHLAGRDVAGVVLPDAADADRGYLALPHGGRRLRSVEGGAARWPELLREHAALQQLLAGEVEVALEAGVPDLRPAQVPAALDALVQRTPLAEDLRADVARAAAGLAEDCALLADGPVPPTVQHDDLHDGNVLVDDAGTARLIDWGDASLAHPFGVLLVTLRALRHRHGFDDAALARCRDAYLEVWTGLADRAALLELVTAAQRVGMVGRAITWHRALAGADDTERAEWGDPVSGWLEVLVGREG